MNLSYRDTLIAVADDCPVDRGVVPSARGGKPTVAVLQHEMIAAQPHVHTQEDVLFEGWLARQPPGRRSRAESARLREAFFAKPQACLRASPLPKTYGWGLLFDRSGRVALCAMESSAYRRIASGEAAGVTVVKAMRARRG